MAFYGDLKHIPLVDVIQLLHNTRTSGILHVNGNRGDCRLIFKSGYMVGAGHFDPALRIGEILVARGATSAASLQKALRVQQDEEFERKPLIITLIELGLVNEKDAFKALKYLIEMTIIEILTWKQGSFRLEASDELVKDDFRYYPEGFDHEISVDIQAVLMDALRIFDEKMRDGELVMEGDAPPEPEPVQPEEALPDAEVLTADDLGLDFEEPQPKQKPKQKKQDGITADDLGLGDLDGL